MKLHSDRMSRFFQSDENDVAFFRDASSCAETKRSTNVWVRAFNSWARSRNKEEDLALYNPEDLNTALEKFYVEIRKHDGEKYEPDSLRVMLAALDRYLKEKSYPYSISRDKIFSSSKSVLEGVARTLRKEGKGNKPNRARSLTDAEEEELWASGQLGFHSPRSLVNTVFFTFCMGNAMRGREKHHSMQIEDLEIQTTDEGKRYIYYRYGNTKTNPGGLSFKPKKISAKLFEKLDDPHRCPIRIFNEYIRRRPASMKNAGPLYLSVIDNPKTPVWFKTSPMGVHTINNIVKTMKNNCPALQGSSKKLTNHTMRKTAVKKLRKNGFKRSEIKNITGHSTEKGLEAYDSGDDEELMCMSNAIL